MAVRGTALLGVTTTAGYASADTRMSAAPVGARLLREFAGARAQPEDLARRHQRLETFLGLACHELRGPASSSSLGVHLAAQRVDRLRQQAAQRDTALASQLSDVRDALTNATNRLERLTRLVSDLLDLSRLHSGQLTGQPAPANLLTIARVAVNEQRQLTPTRHIRLHQPPSRGEIPVWANADRIHQVLTNLLTNALKYSPADRPVEVSVRLRHGWASVAVRDRGPGLPPEEHTRIWEAFHQADGIAVTGGTPHASTQSLGLGLYIAKTIIEHHHGKVGMRSVPGKGSTFWFALPVLPAMAGLAMEEDEELQPGMDAA